MNEEKLVAKLYDGITSAAFIIGASIAFGGGGFVLSFLIECLVEHRNKNDTLSDGSKH